MGRKEYARASGRVRQRAVAELLIDLEEVGSLVVEVADALKASLPGTLKSPRGAQPNGRAADR